MADNGDENRTYPEELWPRAPIFVEFTLLQMGIARFWLEVISDYIHLKTLPRKQLKCNIPHIRKIVLQMS